MGDLMLNELKYQGKRARAMYVYNATMNDELSFVADDVIVITQSSEDETWFEGTLNGRTGWFPSNYVEVIENSEQSAPTHPNDSLKQYESDNQHDTFRIKIINEFKRTEEDFLDEMCKFIKVALIPLQANKNVEIFPSMFLNQLNSNIDELLRCHQFFFQQLKEIQEDSDAKLGYLLINMASRFKVVYESYARNNPKFSNSIHSKKEVLAKFFENSMNKMNFSSINTSVPMEPSAIIAIYLTKYLALPFKQLETYGKLLKELYRFTEDYHVDRGDVQRSMEFYMDLSKNIQEIRNKKECEIDIMESHINNIDDNIFSNGAESLFLASVLLINEAGERKDRILLVFPNYFVLLAQTSNRPNEFDFDIQIPFIGLNQTGHSLLKLKKCSQIELLNKGYASNVIDPISIKYCLELTCINGSQLLMICSTSYDYKMLFDLVSNQLDKLKFSLNNKSLKSSKDALSSTSNPVSSSKLGNSPSFKSGGQPINSPVHNKSNMNTPKHNTSGNTTNQNNSLLNASINSSIRLKTFSMRPHPPLIPHFQLPTDVTLSPGVAGNSSNASSQSEKDSIKRFMYKKAKLSEPFGKYHGADDDLKLLNVIETFCKTKVRNSVSINVQDGVTSPLNKSNANRTSDMESSERSRTELMGDLNETKKSNKELRMMVSNLQKQLEQEKLARRKLENFVRRELKATNFSPNNMSQDIMKLIDHESTI